MSRDFDWMRRMEQQMRHWADDSVRDVFDQAFFGEALWVPRVDVYETEDAVIVKVCAAGVDPDCVDIALSGDGKELVIRGVREDTHEAGECVVKYHQIEIYTGPFQRVITLPGDVSVDRNAVKAVAADGFFRICLPKARKEDLTPRSVPIRQE